MPEFHPPPQRLLPPGLPTRGKLSRGLTAGLCLIVGQSRERLPVNQIQNLRDDVAANHRGRRLCSRQAARQRCRNHSPAGEDSLKRAHLLGPHGLVAPVTVLGTPLQVKKARRRTKDLRWRRSILRRGPAGSRRGTARGGKGCLRCRISDSSWDTSDTIRPWLL